MFWMLYAFFWVIPRLMNFICRRFRTLCLFHLHRHVGVRTYLPMKMEQTECSETSAYKFRCRGITQKKAYDGTGVWRQHGTILLQLLICHPVVCVWLWSTRNKHSPWCNSLMCVVHYSWLRVPALSQVRTLLVRDHKWGHLCACESLSLLWVLLWIK
jgi:hypothetical protein